MKRPGGAAVLLAAALACSPVLSKDCESEVNLKKVSGRTYSVEGEFRAKVPPEKAWSVLSDYEGIPRFVSSMQESRVLERSGARLLLEQKAKGRLLIFSKHVKVKLDVREDRPRSIVFEDVSHEDFESYAGSWTIEEQPWGVCVRYVLKARLRGGPLPFAGRVMAKSAAELLEQVREEMLKEKP